MTGFEEQASKILALHSDEAAVKNYYESLPQEKRPYIQDFHHSNHATVLYNAMIHPLIEFPIRGVISSSMMPTGTFSSSHRRKA